MTKKLFIIILLIVSQLSCKKDNHKAENKLNQKWQLFTLVIVKMDNTQEQNACQYETQVSDLYYESDNSQCNSDDIYDFKKPNILTINFGDKRCSFDQPAYITKNYELKGDSIITNDTRYKIVSLSSDTLILDYCTDINTYPPGTTILNRAKIGIKFFRVK